MLFPTFEGQMRIPFSRSILKFSSLSHSLRAVCDGCAAADAEKIGIPASSTMANRETEQVVGRLRLRGCLILSRLVVILKVKMVCLHFEFVTE